MDITIRFNTDNSSFGIDPIIDEQTFFDEVSKVLAMAGGRIQRAISIAVQYDDATEHELNLKDTNGSTIGSVTVSF